MRKYQGAGIRGAQRGSSMLELLVSILVFAVGIAGFASLQTVSLRDSFDNSQRSQIVVKSQELIDRIRANPGGLGNYLDAFDGGLSCAANLEPKRCGELKQDNGDVAGLMCTQAEMAAYDGWDIFCSSTRANDSIVDLSVVLNCQDRDAADADPCTPASNVELDITWQSRSMSAKQTSTSESALALSEQGYRMVFRP